MKKNGFTLVELIAVLVILSIIALMATPNIISLMQSSKEKSFVSDAEEMVSTAKYMYKSDSIRESNSDPNGSTFTIYMKDLNGTIPDKDPYGYEYDKEDSWITIQEPDDNASADAKRQISVRLKACKQGTEQCHYLCTSNGDNIKTTDISDYNCHY